VRSIGRGFLIGLVLLLFVASLIVIVLISVATLSAGSGGSTVAIKIGGTPGLRFSGDIGSTDSSRMVSGRVPKTFFDVPNVDTGRLSTDTVSVVMQKAGPRGVLKCSVIVDGEVVKSASTKAAYGICQTKWSLPNGS
jgi:hypothetical protein